MNRFACTTLLLVLLAAAGGSEAQGFIHVPSDTPASGSINAWPFSVHGNWRFQMLIPASSLPPARFKITGIAFAPTVNALFSSPDFQVRMAHTPAAALAPCFDSNFAHPPIICFDGPMIWPATANTWSPIKLDRSFGYDGVRNVVIEIRYRGGPGGLLPVRYTGTTQRSYINSGTDPYTAPCRTGAGGGPKIKLMIDRMCVLHCPDTIQIGNSAPITIYQPHPGTSYRILNSFGQGPIVLGGYTMGLTVDPLFWASVWASPPIFNNYSGPVPSMSPVGGSMWLPNLSVLVGLKIYSAALLASTGIQCVTNTDGMEVVP